ncbi:WXG100 family type VII secretion target [Hazenella coriacea]|uniref:Type VII secretion system (Wss) protein ESAT-6 n=1 Tax=Hazenella coriacea TaxID=1179467 RepID=A0A4R3LAA1_9BACL|nr:WXG100 family type VII secretion target [Hazenella coriacea]TCS96622.1 type VII secretion system (Wss) protein ESAT-6 [Hazenella coriacea]
MNVINSPEAVRNYAKQIQRFVQQQNQLLQTLKSAHSNVGGQWRDAQHQKFGQELESMISQIKNRLPEFESYIQHLNAKASQLDDYLR